MLLAIDVGNTNTVFALFDGEEMLADWRCATSSTRTADEYFVWLSHLFAHLGGEVQVDTAVVSSTVPQLVFNLRVLCAKYFECRPVVVGRPECQLGVPVRVDAGTRVGPDRLVNTVAAYDRYGGDLVVVDFGTATTFDVVDQDGAYIGGVIAPGVNLSIKALHDAAAALPHIEISRPAQVIGTNTVDCMQSGVFWGYIGLIEGIVARIKAEHPRPMRVIATGGLANFFDQGTEVFLAVEPDLTLHGLRLIAQLNRAAS